MEGERGGNPYRNESVSPDQTLNLHRALECGRSLSVEVSGPPLYHPWPEVRKWSCAR